MIDGRFASNLSREEKEHLSRVMYELSEKHMKGDADQYEFISRQSAIASRARLENKLSDLEKFSLRMYGRFGLGINKYAREFFPGERLEDPHTLAQNEQRIRGFQLRFSADVPDKIESLKSSMVHSELANREMHSSFVTTINRSIERNAGEYARAGAYLYRVQRVRMGVYSGPDERLARFESENTRIEPGDILRDEAFWSTTTSPQATEHRYSTITGVSATHRKAGQADPINPELEEEILFAIENNEHLRSIDISGFKALQSKDKLSSGERLIKTRTHFRVVGIEDIPAGARVVDRQNKTLRPMRRVVILRS